jgi:hypothetical protein
VLFNSAVIAKGFIASVIKERLTIGGMILRGWGEEGGHTRTNPVRVPMHSEVQLGLIPAQSIRLFGGQSGALTGFSPRGLVFSSV